MKKRNFIQLLLASPLLAFFKKKEMHTIGEWMQGDPNILTVAKLQELDLWGRKHRIKPLIMPTTGEKYYLWFPGPHGAANRGKCPTLTTRYLGENNGRNT